MSFGERGGEILFLGGGKPKWGIQDLTNFPVEMLELGISALGNCRGLKNLKRTENKHNRNEDKEFP